MWDDEDRWERKRERRAQKGERRAEKWVYKPEEPIKVKSSMTQSELEAQVRKRVERRIQKRNAFYSHLVSYLAVNGVLWLIWLVSARDGVPDFPWPIFISFFWGIGLFTNAWAIYQDSGRATARREITIQREIEMEKMRLGLTDDGNYEKPKRSLPADDESEYAKPKRDQAMRLSDDGELIPIDDQERSDNGAADQSPKPPLMRKANRGE